MDGYIVPDLVAMDIQESSLPSKNIFARIDVATASLDARVTGREVYILRWYRRSSIRRRQTSAEAVYAPS
jgi:hypothetical protein